MNQLPLDRTADKRDEVRYSLSGVLPVSFMLPDGTSFEALFVDISHSGLGLLVTKMVISIGDEVVMRSESNKSYELQVVWLKKTKMKGTASEMLRVGLQCKDPQIDLLEEFADTSLIDM